MRLRRFSAALCCAALLTVRLALADAYNPPAGYYSAATGTGSALKSQLDAIMTSGHDLPTYGDARFLLDDTDEDPNNPSNVLLFYNRNSVSEVWVGNSNDFGTREHVWPTSRRPDSAPSNSTRSMGSDLHMLKPLDAWTNNSRGNHPFGTVGTTGSNRHVGDFYYPGDADRGDAARIIFYGATRWGDEGLKIVYGEGNPSNYEMGDLAALLDWHYLDPPDDFERRRNHMIEEFQHNRNAYIDRPEYVWSVYVDQMNDSQITIAGGTPTGGGGTTRNVDLGRVLVGGAVPDAQVFTLNKGGSDGTYYQVSMSGGATSSLTGRYNAFGMGGTDSESIAVGLNASTATAGLRSGTVTIDNLDVTTSGGVGRGANDANDTFTVGLSVVDHATPSFSSSTLASTLVHDFGSVTLGSTAASFSFDVFNLSATPGFTADMDFDAILPSGDIAQLTTDLAPAAGSLSLSAGAGQAFTAMLDTATAGSFSAMYTLMFSDEDLPGAVNKSLTLTLLGEVLAAALPGDYNGDGLVDAADYGVWRSSYGQSVPKYSGADGDGDETIGDGDYLVWAQNFGVSGAGNSAGAVSAAVPEPCTAAMLLFGLLATCRRAR